MPQVGGRAAHLGVAYRVQRAQHLHAGNARVLLGRVAIDQAQHRPALLVDAGQQPLAASPTSTSARRISALPR